MHTDHLEKTESLLRSKTFEELNDPELDFLLQHFRNTSEIRAYQDLLLSVRRSLAEDSVPPPSRNIQQALRRRVKDRSHSSFAESLMALLNYRLRLYQVVIALLMVTGFYSVLPGGEGRQQQVAARDTVQEEVNAAFTSSSMKENAGLARKFNVSL
jgi:hypothetical protein